MKAKLIIALLIFSQIGKAQEIKWISIEEAYSKSKTKPKKVVIDVYTAWCGWCKVMDKKTFSDPNVVKYINDNYYAVKLDAETTKDITIGSTVYKYNPASRVNDGAIALLGGQMSYPNLVYLDEHFKKIQAIPGYMEARQFHEVITFFGMNGYLKENFEIFKAGTYAKTFKDIKF